MCGIVTAMDFLKLGMEENSRFSEVDVLAVSIFDRKFSFCLSLDE